MTPQQESSAAFLQNSGQPQGNPDLLERMLPTIGGVGGGLLGMIGGPLGSIAGAGAGSALGQELENSAAGTNGSLLGAAGSGAIGQGLGLGVGKLAGGLLGAAGDFAGSKAAAAADVGKYAAYKGIKSPGADAAIRNMEAMGVDVSDPQNVIDVVNKFSGREGAHASDLVRNAMIGNTNPVDTTAMRSVAQAVAADPMMPVGQDTKFLASMNKMLGGTEAEGTVTNVNAKDLYDIRQNLQELAHAPGTNPALRTGYKTMMRAADSALSNAGVDQTLIKGGVPEDVMSKAINDNPQLAAQMAEAAQNGVGAVRSFQKPLVDAKEVAQAALDRQGSTVGDAAPAMQQQMGFHPIQALLGLVSHHPVGAAAAGAAGAAAKMSPELMQDVTGALTRLTGNVPAQTVAGQAVTHAGDAAPAGNMTTGDNGMAPNSYQTGGSTGGPSQAWAALFAPQLLPQMRGAEAAQPLLNSAEQAYGNAGGGQGGAGILSAISALIPGTPAYQYNQQKQQLAAAVAAATGMPIQSILGAMPGLMATPGGAQNQFAGVQGSLGNLQSAGTAPSALGAIQ